MKKQNDIFSFQNFLAANPNKKLWAVDYLHAAYELENVPQDFVLCMSHLFNPLFKCLDNFIFLDPLFDQEKYDEYIQSGKTISEVQLWLNLIEVTGIFQGISTKDALNFAESIIEVWNYKIQVEMKSFKGKARAILDKDTQEVFVTID